MVGIGGCSLGRCHSRRYSRRGLGLLLGCLGGVDVLFSTMVWTGVWLLVGFRLFDVMKGEVYTEVSPVTALAVGLSSMMEWSVPSTRVRVKSRSCVAVSRGNCLGS